MKSLFIFLILPIVIYSSYGINYHKVLNSGNDNIIIKSVLGVSPDVISEYCSNTKMMADDFDWTLFSCSCIGGFVVSVMLIWWYQVGD